MPKQAVKKISKSHERQILDLIKNSDLIGLAAFLASLCDLKLKTDGRTLSAERVAEALMVLSMHYGEPLDRFYADAGLIIGKALVKLSGAGAITLDLEQRIAKFAVGSGYDVRTSFESAIKPR